MLLFNDESVDYSGYFLSFTGKVKNPGEYCRKTTIFSIRVLDEKMT